MSETSDVAPWRRRRRLRDRLCSARRDVQRTKVAYAALRTASDSTPTALAFEDRLQEKLALTFQPEDLNVGRIVRRRVGGGGLGGGNNKAEVAVEHDAGELRFTLHTKGARRVRIQSLSGRAKAPVVFLPPHEMLSLSSGFLDLARDYEIPFDETYVDAVTALMRPTLRRRPQYMDALEAGLVDDLGGEVIHENGRFYVRLTGGGKMEAPLVAEGLRKLASLIRLLQNGSISRGSVLFWDEPEANLNPMLSQTVADTITALAALGIQVILATHDYFIVSRLSLAGLGRASKKPDRKTPRVQFIGLDAPGDDDGTVLETSQGVALHAANRLEDLPNALIVNALIRHADYERQVLLERVLE
jgi:hypothetical protein